MTEMSQALAKIAAYHQSRLAARSPAKKAEVLRKAPPSPFSRIGMGLGAFPVDKIRSAEGGIYAGLAAAGILDLMSQAKACPVYNLPTQEETRWTIAGPLLDQDVTENFGPTIDPFGSTKNPPGIAYVETTMAQNGELQTPMIVMALGVHLESEPVKFSMIGNAWTHPTVPGAQPPSPNVFTQNDRFNGALGAAFAGAAPTEFMIPAILDWGVWFDMAMWHMVRGYNLQWKVGQHTNILYDLLRNTAFMPSGGQDGSASSSQIGTADFVRRLNDVYDLRLATGMNFLKTNFTRYGTVTTGAGVYNGLFLASRIGDQAAVTYGGPDLRSALRDNKEFRPLRVPYLLDKGVPIGISAQENDPVQAGLMRRYLSASLGGSVVPPFITDEQNINAVPTAGGAGVVMLEQTLDVAPAVVVNVPQQIDAERAYFKGGEGKISFKIKGYEVDDDWYTTLKNNQDLRDALLEKTSIEWAK